ncbi:MAG: phospholipid carrier-dependent glycosyltransferase [Acidobacteriota bacterium]
MRTSRVALAAVLLAAAVLRFWALGRGIPYSVQVDEPEIVERAFNMMRHGSLNPHGFFDYPGLSLYLQFVVSCVRFLTGAISGKWTSLDQASTASFYLWGRAVVATFGVATVLLVYQIGMRWGGRHALLAAGLFAVLPLHVRYSHYVLTDTPLTFFVTLTFLLSLAAHERNTLGAFAWAGAAAGLAAATKYNGGVALVMPLLACWMTVPARPSRRAAASAAIVACVAAFLVAAPYTILDLPGFLNAFARLAGEYRNIRPHEPIWLLYSKLLLRNAFSWPALLLAAGGLGLGLVRIVRGPGRVRWAVAVVFPLVYLWMLSGQGIVYARYLLPVVPSLCILAAAAVVSGVSLLRRYEIARAPRTALIAGLTIAAVLPPAVMSIRWDRDAARRSTVDDAYTWIIQNVPRESSVVLESRALLLLPAGYGQSRIVPQLTAGTYESWRDEGVQYLVASSQRYGPYFDTPATFPREYAAYMRIFVQSRELVRFTPSKDLAGPEIRIFKVIP